MRRIAFVLVALGLVGACSASPKGASTPPTPATAPVRLMTMGGAPTEGDGVEDRLRAAWPYLVFRESLPRSTTFVNMATDIAPAAAVNEFQASFAAEFRPDVVAMWTGTDDLAIGTAADDFAAALTDAITTVRASGTPRIFVGDLPTSYGDVGAYNDAIGRVARATGATVVDLRAVPAGAAGSLPDASAHRAIAAAFGRAITG